MARCNKPETTPPPVSTTPATLPSTVAEVSKLLDKFGLPGFVSSILGAPQDYIEKWRSNNVLRWFAEYHRTRAANASEGLPPPPPSLLIPALRCIADEDDMEMLSLWAKLVAGFDVPSSADQARKVFVALLSGMTSGDARLLIYLLGRDPLPNTGSDVDVRPLVQERIKVDDAGKALNLSIDAVSIAVGNLSRLGCLIATPLGDYLVFGLTYCRPLGAALSTYRSDFIPTALGAALVAALSPKAPEGTQVVPDDPNSRDVASS